MQITINIPNFKAPKLAQSLGSDGSVSDDVFITNAIKNHLVSRYKEHTDYLAVRNAQANNADTINVT